MRTVQVPNILFPIAGVAAVMAAIFLIAGFTLHPAGEDATFGTDPRWVPAHALLWAAFTLALPGWIGVYLWHAAEARILGVVALVVAVVGTSLASWIYSTDVTFVPVLAAEAPQLFETVYARGALGLGIGTVVSWVLGNILFGIAVVRARVFSRWAGILLAIGTAAIPIAYLVSTSVRVVAIGGYVAAIGQAWLGIELLRFMRGRRSIAA